MSFSIMSLALNSHPSGPVTLAVGAGHSQIMKPPHQAFHAALTSSPSAGPLNRMVTVRLSSWILGLAFLGLPLLAQAQDVTSGTAIYGTGQAATDWTGGIISPGATLRLDDGGTVSGDVTNNGTLQYNESGNLTISNTVAGTGTLSLTGSGILTLSGANTYTGATTVSTGVLNLQNANALGTIAAGTNVLAGAALQIQGGITTLEEALTLNGTGVSADGALRNISGNNTYAGLVTLGAPTRINSDAGTLTLSNAGTITGDTFGLTVGGAGNTTISSIIGTTSGTLTKDGTGTLTLTKTNTYSGGLTMVDSAGTVIAYTNSGTNVSALGSGAVAIGSGSTLELRSQNTLVSATAINNTFTGTGLLKLSSSATGGVNNYLGGINGFSGTVELAYTGTHVNILTGSSSARTSVINAPNATLQINSGNTVYVGFYGSQTWKDIKVSGSGNAEGYGAIRFDSNSTLTVTGSVSLLGDTTIGTGGGTLNGAITSGAGGTQTLTLGTSKTTSGAVTLSGAIGGGIGSIALNKTQGNIVILTGANTYTGATTVSGGILNIRHANALGTTAAGTTVSSGATLQIHGGITTAEEPLTLNGLGVNTLGALRNFNGNNTYTGLVTLGSPTRINSAIGTTLTLSNTGTITGDTFGLTVGGEGNTTIASIIGTTSGTLTKDGIGTLTLSAANTYTGATTVSSGTLQVDTDNALGTNAAGTSVSAGAALKLNGVNYSSAEALSLNGTGISNGGALVNSGTSTFAGQITAATNASINAGGGTLNLTGGLVKNGTTATLMGGGRVNITGTGISGASANSDLVVDGTTVVVSAASNYNGPTTVQNSGTFVANAAITTTAVTVSSSSTLSGTGSITTGAGSYIYINGKLEVGDSTLGTPVASNLGLATSAGGSTVLGATGLMDFNIFQRGGDLSATVSAADYLSLTGTLDATLGGTLLLGNTNSLTGFTAGDSWKLFDLTNGNITGGFTNLDYSALNLGSGLTGSLNYATGVFSISSTSIIPEPSRALLLLTGLVSLLLHRKRQA
ncbi:MAG: autotransporter-associated beta strand repeat-containing protein [Verrucomicrobia bacterium]|jgi:fibronectin-binding autotransporter adhesin|nr:autotransporter-associated beta strand repeat-containing protein [Verrucomicrobiota bacterium]